MYINTKTRKSIEESICQALDITIKDIDDLLVECYFRFEKDHQIFFLDDQYDFFKTYIRKHLKQVVDSVLFIHLSRRLDGDTNDNTYNLADILIENTSLSSYLKKYGLTFKHNQYIRMFVCGQEVNLENNEYEYDYLKRRFGYYQKDSIDGYAFADGIENSKFYEIAVGGPELFGHLYLFDVDDDSIIDEFILKSTFYQYEYLMPIDEVYFENYEELSNQEKQYHILIKALQRLYFYKYDFEFNTDDNTIITIKGNKRLTGDSLLNKIELVDTDYIKKCYADS